MTPERWQQVKGVLQSVLELPPSEQGAFLKRACDGDQELRQEVESLLAAGKEGRSGFLQSPPMMHLSKGTHVGDYEIQSLLGAGGMGEVYRARDLRLRRDVAIKVLPAFVSSDPDRLRRFEQEATAAAALNHPNILAVYQMGTHQGTPYLVSELLEGETLREQIRRGRLAVRKAIDNAVQIARGLAAAHEKGIVHRDLKPENLFVTKDGRLKILDFGLAKLLQPQPSSEQSAPTLGSETEPGVVMGTVGYMAPEQVRGQPADHRADIFAFGTILYEMLSGKRAFQKPTSPETMTAILNEDPPGISQLVPDLPPALQRVVHRCLEKNPEQRFQSASDLAFALEALSESGTFPASPKEDNKTHTLRATSRLGMGRKVILPLALAVVVLAVGGYFYLHRGPKLTDEDTIVLADFTNTTGDPVFDDTLKTALAVELGQSPFLNLLSDRRVSETLRMMGRPVNERVTVDVGRELCLRTGSKAILSGSISSIGGPYVIGLLAVVCATGEVLDREQVEALNKPDVLKALHQAASALRAKLGESLPSVQKFDVPVEATASSLDALKNYSMSIIIGRAKGDAPSIPFLKRAIELDPNFPMAYAGLAVRYGNLHQPSLALEYATKAYRLRDRATEREKLRITASYFNATGEMEKKAQTYELWIADYPRDSVPHGNLGANYAFMGQYEKALAEYQESLRLAPDVVLWYADLGMACYSLNRLDEAKSAFDQAQARKLDDGLLRGAMYYLAFLWGDSAQMEQQVAWGAGKPGNEDLLLSAQSDTEAYFGRRGKARDFSRRAVDSAVRTDARERAALWQVNAALREAEWGDTASAKHGVTAALVLSPGRDVKVALALALARMGDDPRATALVGELEKSYPANTLLKLYWLPTINAAIELNKGNSSQALVSLEAPTPYELGDAGFINYVYPAYVRGQAHLMAHNGAAAAAEFQKLLDHRGVVLNFVTGALAHLQLGRAYVLAGDKDKARIAYKDFLTLWKDADPDIPILKQAKAEYAKLQ